MDLEAAQPDRSSSAEPRPAPCTVSQLGGGRGTGFADRVAALRVDAVMVKMAVRLARDRDLAEDALQETWYAVATHRDPARIRDLRLYFRQVLRRKVVRLLEQAGGAQLTDDPDLLLAARAGGLRGSGPRRPVSSSSPAEDDALRIAQLAGWLARLDLLGTGCVPGRSADPECYRRVILSASRILLCSLIAGEFSSVDVDQLLIQRYPEWFGSLGSSRAARDQRLSRGRRDVTSALESVIRRYELLA
jgi:hypothetical protein